MPQNFDEFDDLLAISQSFTHQISSNIQRTKPICQNFLLSNIYVYYMMGTLPQHRYLELVHHGHDRLLNASSASPAAITQ